VLTPGPYIQVPISSEVTAPFYALRYDERGRSTGPLTESHLADALASGDFTDVFLFSHGWNNDWETALRRYGDFIAEYRRLREGHQLTLDREYRPVLAGVFWPSTALVLPWEKGPDFAGDDDGVGADGIDLAVLADVAGRVADTRVARFYELAERRALTEREARECLEILSPIYDRGDPDLEGDGGRDCDEMLVAWARLDATVAASSLPLSPDDIGPAATGPIDAPEVAGFLDKLDPRNIVRAMTVWQMKDRAGRVGAGGVGALLRGVQDTVTSDARLHLIGHSYGARVLLTALTRAPGPRPVRAVNSMLLLQPAINHLCFADRLPSGRAGGFREALALVKQPSLSTFSVHDDPLHNKFHLALRRGKDLGEVEVAADEPPSEYAALGGYGPRGFAGWLEVPIKDATDPYELGKDAPEVWAVNGSRRIAGHGDVVNPATAWALHCLARA
jgi:hypothetical protein